MILQPHHRKQLQKKGFTPDKDAESEQKKRLKDTVTCTVKNAEVKLEACESGESDSDIEFLNPIWTGGTGIRPLRFSSITPKCQKILKTNFLTLTLHL